MFEVFVKQAEDMRARIDAGREKGLAASGNERVGAKELLAWEAIVATNVRRVFGVDSPEGRDWAALVTERPEIVGAAMKGDPDNPKASSDGYLDYLNLAIGKINGFAAAIAARGGVNPSPLQQFYAWKNRLPQGLQVAVVLLLLGLAGWAWWQDHHLLPVPVPELVLNVSAWVPVRTETINRSFEISDENDAHNLIGTNIKDYSRSFNSDPGYRITDYVWMERSATRVSNRLINVDSGGGRITMTFRLNAGPQSDRYRGWLRGTLQTTQVRTIGPETRVLVARLAVSGSATKNIAVSLSDVTEIRVSDSGGSPLVIGPVGSPLTLLAGKVTIRVDAQLSGARLSIDDRR